MRVRVEPTNLLPQLWFFNMRILECFIPTIRLQFYNSFLRRLNVETW